MGDRELYLRASDAALEWAWEMDKALILRRLFPPEPPRCSHVDM
jgi:hypothetical protein